MNAGYHRCPHIAYNNTCLGPASRALRAIHIGCSYLVCMTGNVRCPNVSTQKITSFAHNVHKAPQEARSTHIYSPRTLGSSTSARKRLCKAMGIYFTAAVVGHCSNNGSCGVRCKAP